MFQKISVIIKTQPNIFGSYSYLNILIFNIKWNKTIKLDFAKNDNRVILSHVNPFARLQKK